MTDNRVLIHKPAWELKVGDVIADSENPASFGPGFMVLGFTRRFPGSPRIALNAWGEGIECVDDRPMPILVVPQNVPDDTAGECLRGQGRSGRLPEASGPVDQAK